MKFSNIQANDTQDCNLSGSIDQSFMRTVNLATGVVAKAMTRDAKIAPSTDDKRTMSFVSDPITDQNDVYQKYIAFANNPNYFVMSNCPPKFPVHIMRKCNGMYFWVPTEAAAAFFDLCMQTTFMREKNKDSGLSIDGAVALKIEKVENFVETPPTPEREAIIYATITFNKAVPYGAATLVIDLADGTKLRAKAWPLADNHLTQQPTALGQPSTRFDIDIDEGKAAGKYQEKDLTGRPGRFYSFDYPPEISPIKPTLDQINENVSAIRNRVQLLPTSN